MLPTKPPKACLVIEDTAKNVHGHEKGRVWGRRKKGVF